jgi:hypothetical protein
MKARASLLEKRLQNGYNKGRASMNPLYWDPEALRDYRRLCGGLPSLRREQLEDRVDCLREWPPSKWYELRDREDGAIAFQLETDQFARILGCFEQGAVYITHVELRSRERG